MPDSKAKILCIDDDPDVLDFLKIVLEGAGYEFLGAEGAETGLEAYRAHHPDVVIVDLMLEEVDSGAGLAKELRLLGNRAPVFLLSSVGDNLNQATDTVTLGLAGVFQKPLAAAHLLTVIEATLAEAPQA